MQNPKTRVYMDVSRLCLTKFTTGIQRVAKEIVLRFLEDPALEVTLLSDSGTHDAWRVIPREGFLAKYRDGAADLFGDSAPYLLTPFEIAYGVAMKVLMPLGVPDFLGIMKTED